MKVILFLGLLTTAAFSLAEAGTLTEPDPMYCGLPSAGKISYREIVEKYADPDSKFVTLEGLDGIRTHYKVAGNGPAILLVHSSTGDLKDWEGWVETLTPSYRVVRFDLPAFGLTGPVPSGNYSIDRYLALVDALMDHLDIEEFAIAGASYGGLVAFRYAGTRSGRVTALVLQNSAGIEYGGRRGTTEYARDAAAQFDPKLATEAELSTFLNTVINDAEKVTPQLVARKTDYTNMVGRDCESFLAGKLYERGNPERVLGKVQVPALVLWGGANKALSLSTADAFADALSNAPVVEKIIHEGGGHLLHIERPEATSKDVKAFLDEHIEPLAARFPDEA